MNDNVKLYPCCDNPDCGLCHGSGIASDDNPEVRRLNEQLAALADDTKAMPDLLPAWKKVFREGLLPHIGEVELRTLRRLVIEDDHRLLQGATTTPPPLMCTSTWPVEAACPLTVCGWARLGGEELSEITVGEAEEQFAALCYNIDQTVGEPGGCRHLLNWWDEAPRDEARRELLGEINLALASKE